MNVGFTEHLVINGVEVDIKQPTPVARAYSNLSHPDEMVRNFSEMVLGVANLATPLSTTQKDYIVQWLDEQMIIELETRAILQE